MEKRKKAWLFRNLLQRMEYNTNSQLWKLSGPITADEMDACREALKMMEWRVREEAKSE